MQPRIAVVQPGDYPDALRRLEEGEGERYFGVRHSVEALTALLDGFPHLLVSLHGPPGRTPRAEGVLSCVPRPRLPRLAPGRLVFELWARRVVAEVSRFAPTHVLLRAGGRLGLRVLQHCLRNRLEVLAVLAEGVTDASPRARRLNRRLMDLLNDPCVVRVGNYKTVATRSMIECGLRTEKAVPWEFPGARNARDHPVKTRDPDDTCHVVFAANLIPGKGGRDVVDAVVALHGAGARVSLTVLGDGPELGSLRARASGLSPGVVTFFGRLPNDEMFELLLESTVVCVPSRHEFPEGLPMTLTEALASRTPVIASDHPVFARTFMNGQGVRMFQAGNPTALADEIRRVAGDPDLYAQLSKTTQDAFARTSCERSFGDLLAQWRREIVRKSARTASP